MKLCFVCKQNASALSVDGQNVRLRRPGLRRQDNVRDVTSASNGHRDRDSVISTNSIDTLASSDLGFASEGTPSPEKATSSVRSGISKTNEEVSSLKPRRVLPGIVWPRAVAARERYDASDSSVGTKSRESTPIGIPDQDQGREEFTPSRRGRLRPHSSLPHGPRAVDRDFLPSTFYGDRYARSPSEGSVGVLSDSIESGDLSLDDDDFLASLGLDNGALFPSDSEAANGGVEDEFFGGELEDIRREIVEMSEALCTLRQSQAISSIAILQSHCRLGSSSGSDMAMPALETLPLLEYSSYSRASPEPLFRRGSVDATSSQSDNFSPQLSPLLEKSARSELSSRFAFDSNRAESPVLSRVHSLLRSRSEAASSSNENGAFVTRVPVTIDEEVVSTPNSTPLSSNGINTENVSVNLLNGKKVGRKIAIKHLTSIQGYEHIPVVCGMQHLRHVHADNNNVLRAVLYQCLVSGSDVLSQYGPLESLLQVCC